MTNTKGIVLLFTLATILITGGLTMAPLAYSTGNDDSHDDSGCHDDSYDDSHDDSDCNPEPDCECKKPTVFSVIYNGPGIEGGLEGTPDAEVTVEIYKKVDHIGDKDPLLTIDGIFDGESIIIDSNVYGKKKINSNTVYRVIQNDVEIAVISFHTSCSQPLFIGDMHSDGPVTVTVESGFDHKGRQSIFLPVDPICNEIPETTLEVTKVLIPADDPGMFILQIDGAPESGEVGDGGTTGPVDVIPGPHTVGETNGAGTNLDDYTTTISGDCDEFGNITLEEGDDAECIITNTKIVPAMITLKKTVTNDNTSDANAKLPTDFILNVTNVDTDVTTVIEHGVKTNIDPGTYVMGEISPDNYSFVLIAGDTGCPTIIDNRDALDTSDEFTISAGEHLTCVIYNDDDFVPGGVAGDLPIVEIEVRVLDVLLPNVNDFTYEINGVPVDMMNPTVPIPIDTQVIFEQTNFIGEDAEHPLIIPTSIQGDGNCPDVIGPGSTGVPKEGTLALSANHEIKCIIVYGEPEPIFFHRNSFPVTLVDDGLFSNIESSATSFGCPMVDERNACLNSSVDSGFTFVLTDPAITSETTTFLISFIPVNGGIDAPDCAIQIITPNGPAFDLALACLNFFPGDYILNYVLFESDVPL